MINEILQWFAIAVIYYAFRRYNFAQAKDHAALWKGLGMMAACLGYGKQDFFEATEASDADRT